MPLHSNPLATPSGEREGGEKAPDIASKHEAEKAPDIALSSASTARRLRPLREFSRRPSATTVRVLQATDGVRVRVREPDGVDEPDGEPGGGCGLRGVEQRPRPALLRLRLMQGRRAGRPAQAVAQGHRRAHLRLRRWLQRVPQRANRGTLPPLQMGKLLTISPTDLLRTYVHADLKRACIVIPKQILEASSWTANGWSR